MSAIDSDSDGDSDSRGDARIERTCDIARDISADVSDRVDRIPEARDRFKDLLDDYGEAAPDIAGPLQQMVSSPTRVKSLNCRSRLRTFPRSRNAAAAEFSSTSADQVVNKAHAASSAGRTSRSRTGPTSRPSAGLPLEEDRKRRRRGSATEVAKKGGRGRGTASLPTRPR
jgi:hypothetical protein